MTKLRRIAFGLVALASVGALGACSDTSRSSEAFCDKLGEVTGAEGVEATLAAGDPGRIDGVVRELNELLDRAPQDISTAISTLVEFFEQYQRAPRGERRDLLAANERSFSEASRQLDEYALETCGLFLQRTVPTPIPTADPGVEIAPE